MALNNNPTPNEVVKEIKTLEQDKMDKTNPTGTGSFSLNRANGKTIGNYSFAEGHITTSSGYASHSEGAISIASGDASHAEGENTNASGGSSHAEGNSTVASGYNSHAEGNSTEASGYNSHAEGEGTIAQRKSQHVFGEYNIADTYITDSNRGKYVEIVGNGTAVSARSNARTLDWNGNEYIKGKLQSAGLTDGTTTQNMTTIVNLPTRVDTINTNLTNEVTNRQNADETLQSNINTKMNISGGKFTGEVEFNEIDGNCINFDSGIYINKKNGSTLLGSNGTLAWIGTPDTTLTMRGNENRPTYNGNNVALQVDVNNKLNKTNPYGTGSFSMNRKSNTVIGSYSFAEGYQTEARGEASHAEGRQTQARGENSHCEGQNTIATGINQHVSGKYNIEDTENKYAEIIGNGTAVSARSNARTLDWNGNEYLAGNLQASGLTDGTTTKTMSEILAGGGGNKANVDASNLSDGNVTSWQQKLITSAIAGNGIGIENGVISSSSNSTLLNATKYNITTDTRVPVSKATLQQYSYILIEAEGYDAAGVNRNSRVAGYFKVSDLVEYEYANDYNSMSFYSRKYAVLGTINFAVNTNDLMFSCEFAKPYEQTNLNATADDNIYIGNIWGIK